MEITKFKNELKDELKDELKKAMNEQFMLFRQEMRQEWYSNLHDFKKEFRKEIFFEFDKFKKDIKNDIKSVTYDNQIKQLINYNKECDYQNEVIFSLALRDYVERKFYKYKVIKPTDKQVPKDLFIKNKNNKKKLLTDFDGIFIAVPRDIYKTININNNSLNFYYENDYKLFIVESKHKLSLSMIKRKIGQIVNFVKLLNSPDATKFMTKLKKENIYLFFAAPVIEDNIKDFILNKEFLLQNKWRDNNKYGFHSIDEILFLENKIGFIEKNGYDSSVLYDLN